MPKPMLLETHTSEIETILAKYTSRRSALLPLLYVAQDAYGHLTEAAMREVAAILELPPTDVVEVVGFYTLFYSRPVGTWMLQVCDDVPCCYLGAEELITALKDSLGISEEQTTPDGMFTLQRVKCLAACDRAPMLQANLDYVYDVTAAQVDTLLADLRARAAEAKKRGVSGRFAEDYEVTNAGAVHHLAREAPYAARAFEIVGSPTPPPRDSSLPLPELPAEDVEERKPSPL